MGGSVRIQPMSPRSLSIKSFERRSLCRSQRSPSASAMTLERKFAKRFRFNALGEG